MHADRIVVLDAGRDRRHRDARASCSTTNETYREIVYSQLSEAEAVGMSGPRPAGGARPAAVRARPAASGGRQGRAGVAARPG